MTREIDHDTADVWPLDESRSSEGADWSRLDRRHELDRHDVSDQPVHFTDTHDADTALGLVDDRGDRAPKDDVGRRADQSLLSDQELDDLDQALERIEPADRYPGRYREATPAQDLAVRDAYATDHDPHRWAGQINPGYLRDLYTGRTGRTLNCAACSRAVQDTIEGRPRAAPALRRGGLPLERDGRTAGEHPHYTEIWAGQAAEPATATDIEQRLRDAPRGERSAIVFGYRRSGGHAFNAVMDPDGEVQLVDGQTGTVRRWDADDLASRYPTLEAIYFHEPAAKGTHHDHLEPR